jgi:CelD/BcsL family acetyltransferase involved in cellulose biosynthesis
MNAKKNPLTMSSYGSISWKNLPASSLQQNPDLSAQWDRLNAARGDIPFLMADAMITALKAFGNGQERLLLGQQDSVAAAMFLLVPLRNFSWQTFQPSQIPLGAWVAQAHLPLVDLARSIIHGPLGFCLSLSITQVDPLFTPRGGDSPDCCSSDYIETGWIDLHGTFEEYWSVRGKNLRQNMRKQRSKLATERIAGHMRELTDHSEIASAIERYGTLESAGWKAAQGTAIHRDNAQGSFYRKLLEGAAQRGEAVIHEYLFDDRVVASNLCLQRKGTLVVLKTTHDESIDFYSPASLLRQDEMEQLYRKKAIGRLEYYGRMMEWHSKWTGNKRMIYHLTLYRWPVLKQFSEWRRRRATGLTSDRREE